tara:strand:+ start:6703 stop:10395 length:3693 start_codon:yes stop_codon:yes gene_type:complete
MAKKKVFIDVVIDDKGTTKRVAVDAKKLGKNLDETSTSARTADRNIKGVANTSSNATKNFSKMAQGTGGLVAAYATLAANIFAISAAYNFLKKAGDLRVLREGQELYAATTGTSLKVVTMQLQSATQGLLKYADAAQGAAIGTAAGLSSDQLSGLAQAASNVSKALGRDLTDSYNRLVRGATKAEPELLDELGIILRLEVATSKYADKLGIAAKDLTAFERTQAVTNEILEQANDKFDKFGDIDVSGIERLGKAFDDVVNTIMKVIEPLSSFIGNIMADNVTALGVAFAGLGAGIVRSITPAMPTLQGVDTSTQGIAQRMQAFNPGGATGERISKAAAGKGNLTKQDVKRFEDAIDRKKSKVLDFERTNQREARKTAQIAKLSLLEMERANQTGLTKMRTGWQIYWGTLIAEHGRTMGIMKGITMGFTNAIGKILGAAGYIGLIISAGVLLKSLYQKVFADQERLANQRVIADVAKDVEKMKNAIDEARNSLISTGNSFDDFGIRVKNSLQAVYREPLRRLGEMNTELKDQLAIMTKLYDFNEKVFSEATKYAKANPVAGGSSLGAGISFNAGTNVTEAAGNTAPDPDAVRKAKAQINMLRDSMEGYKDVFKEMVAEEEYRLTFMDKNNNAYGLQQTRINSLNDALLLVNGTYDETTEGNLALVEAGNEVNALIRVLVKELSAGEKAFTDFDRANQQVIFGFKKFSDAMSKMGSFKTPFTPFISGLQEISNGMKKVEGLSEILEFKTQYKDSELKKVVDGILGAQFVLDGTEEGFDKLQNQINDMLETYKKMSKLSATEKNNIKTRIEIGKRGLPPLLAKEVEERGKISLKINEIRDKEQEIVGFLLAKDTLSTEQIESYESQLDFLNAQKDTLKEMITDGHQLSMALKSGFETSFQKNFSDFLKGDQNSIKDAVIGIARGTLSSFADKFSEQITKKVSNAFFGKSEAEKQAELIKRSHVEGIIEGFQAAKDGGLTAQELEGLKTPLSEAEKAKSTHVEAIGKEMGVETKVAGQNNVTNGIRQPSGKVASEALEHTLLTTNRKAGGLAGVLGNFTERLTGLFDGDAPFLTKLGGLFSGLLTDFGGVFQNLFSGLSGMFGAGGTGVGGFFSSIAGIFGFANGGIVKGGFRKYANGGIAKSPHLGMIGEGKYNEAVVPLPDGRSIPVTPGSGMGTNNVTVNVSIDNEGKADTRTQSDSSMGADLGKLVARAVQEELQYQKRSGGILNPYGAA